MHRWVLGAADTKVWNRQSDAFNQTRITPPWIWFVHTVLHWAQPIRWPQERRKTSRGNEKIRPSCRNTFWYHLSPQHNPQLWLNSVLVERAVILIKKNHHIFHYMPQVRWCVGGATLLTQIICWTLNAAQFRIKKQICWFSVIGDPAMVCRFLLTWRLQRKSNDVN